MRALVVYESMFGNTQRVAAAVADGIASVMSVETVEVAAAPDPSGLDVDLLVVGAPTHAFGLSRASTRRDAAERTGRPVVSSGRGVREWLASAGRTRVPVAAFDTHVRKPNLPGWAGRAAEKRLRRLGGEVVADTASFSVDGMEGPLVPGELERAQRWGAAAAAAAAARACTGS